MPQHTTMPIKPEDLKSGNVILWDDNSLVRVVGEPRKRGIFVDVNLGGVGDFTSGAPYTYTHDEKIALVTGVMLTEEEFDERFTLIEVDGSQTIDDFATMKRFPANQVWSLVDGDGDGGMALVSGFAVVNHIAWQITEEPHNGENYYYTVNIPGPDPEPEDTVTISAETLRELADKVEAGTSVLLTTDDGMHLMLEPE